MKDSKRHCRLTFQKLLHSSRRPSWRTDTAATAGSGASGGSFRGKPFKALTQRAFYSLQMEAIPHLPHLPQSFTKLMTGSQFKKIQYFSVCAHHQLKLKPCIPRFCLQTSCECIKLEESNLQRTQLLGSLRNVVYMLWHIGGHKGDYRNSTYPLQTHLFSCSFKTVQSIQNILILLSLSV